MPVFYHDKSGARRLWLCGFESEMELYKLLLLHPELILDDEGGGKVVAIEIPESLFGIGNYLLLVDANGQLRALRPKLACQLEPKREIFAQVFELLNEFSAQKIEKIDRILQGQLETALRSFSKHPDDEYELNLRWQACEAFLTNENIPLVIAVDQTTAELESTINFLGEHSDFCISLVAIEKYNGENQESLLIPQTVLRGKNLLEIKPLLIPENSRPEFEGVISVYRNFALENFDICEEGPCYRTIRLKTWSRGVHYEFYDYGKEIGVELHLENDEVQMLEGLLRSFELRLAKIFTTAIVNWDSKWSRGRGRLRVLAGPGASTSEIVALMKTLIRDTWEAIDQTLGNQVGSTQTVAVERKISTEPTIKNSFEIPEKFELQFKTEMEDASDVNEKQEKRLMPEENAEAKLFFEPKAVPENKAANNSNFAVFNGYNNQNATSLSYTNKIVEPSTNQTETEKTRPSSVETEKSLKHINDLLNKLNS